MFTKEGILSEIERSGIFTLTYRLIIQDQPVYVQLKAAVVNEKEGRRLIVGINNIDSQIRQEEEYAKRLAQAQTKASVDALTGIKNKHAYLEAEDKLNSLIAEGCPPAFAVTVLDINDLKTVNDRQGHQAGDQYIRDACMIVCKTFKHSPVFRVGSDEFAVISQGEDYQHIDELVGVIAAQNEKAREGGGIIIACGMARYEKDACVASVFERADDRMYENKSSLKAKD